MEAAIGCPVAIPALKVGEDQGAHIVGSALDRGMAVVIELVIVRPDIRVVPPPGFRTIRSRLLYKVNGRFLSTPSNRRGP